MRIKSANIFINMKMENNKFFAESAGDYDRVWGTF